MEKNRGEPKKKVKRIPSKTMCKTTPKKELYIDYKGDFPLYNPKHEAFVINLLTMKQGEAYTKAGYSQTGENALKAGGNLLANNQEVTQRFQYLKKKQNEELEKKGLISREQMIANAIYAMNCSLGKLPVKKFVKYSEGTETVEAFEHDIKAFPAIWDKLMNALDYYPKDKNGENLPLSINFIMSPKKRGE